MSNVTLIIISNDDIHSVTAHWREIKALLAKKPAPLNSNIDAAYILLDLNKKVIINSQDAFAIELKGFEMISV